MRLSERAPDFWEVISWFVNQAGKTQGPLPDQRIRQLIRWGKISRAAYLCDEQLSGWVSIQRTAFASLLAPSVPPSARERADGVRLLGALRGGPLRLSTRGARRLGGILTLVSVIAGALQLASGLAMSYGAASATDEAADTAASPANPPVSESAVAPR